MARAPKLFERYEQVKAIEQNKNELIEVWASIYYSWLPVV